MTAISAQNSPIEAALMMGNLKGLTTDQRLSYYNNLCQSLGLNSLTSPFQYLELNGKLVLYATKAAAEQLRSVKGISVTKIEKELIDGMFVITAYAIDKTGRMDSSTAAIDLSNLKGEAKANAMMKCETKAKRRLTLSLSGLGMMDETEVETVQGAAKVSGAPAQTEVVNIAAPTPSVAADPEQVDAGPSDQVPASALGPELEFLLSVMRSCTSGEQAGKAWKEWRGKVEDISLLNEGLKLYKARKSELGGE